MSDASRAVFLSYASQDAETARRMCEALRTAGVEVWFDQSELRGGDAWDQKIRKQIRDCVSQTGRGARPDGVNPLIAAAPACAADFLFKSPSSAAISGLTPYRALLQTQRALDGDMAAALVDSADARGAQKTAFSMCADGWRLASRWHPRRTPGLQRSAG